MNNLALTLRAVNVPRDLAHVRRALEIQQVVDYLRVDAQAADNLALVHSGVDAPPLDQQDLLWVKRTPEGLPAGLFLFSEGDWKRATPNIVESETASLQIRTGAGTFTHNTTADTVNKVQIAAFTPEFAEIPEVYITVKGGSLYTDASTYSEWAYQVIPAKDKWELEVRCTVDCSTANKTLAIGWMAIGVIE